jgi:hypothetical protein
MNLSVARAVTADERKVLLTELFEHPAWDIVMLECGRRLRESRTELWKVGPSPVLDQMTSKFVGEVTSLRDVIMRIYHDAGMDVPDEIRAFID